MKRLHYLFFIPSGKSTCKVAAAIFLCGISVLFVGCVAPQTRSVPASPERMLPPQQVSDFAGSSGTDTETKRLPGQAVELLEGLRKDGQLCLSLNDCFVLVPAQNLDVQLAGERVAQAASEITEARAAMLPFLGAEGSYLRLDKELNFAMGPQSLTFMERDIYKGGLVARQPLFTGGRLIAGYEAARHSRDARAHEKRCVEAEMVFQTAHAYLSAQVADSFQKVAAQAVALLQTHEHDVSALLKNGAAPEIDLLRTQTELANARKELNAAENAVDLARSALKNLLNIDLEETIVLTEKMGQPRAPADNLSSLTRKALSQRPELSALNSQIAAAEQALKAARGEYLPSVALEARDEYMQGDVRDLEGGEHWTVGVGVEFPVWNWGQTTARVKKAALQLSQVRIQRQKTAAHIRLEVRGAYLALKKAGKDIEAAGAALKTSEEAYRLARASYQAGEGTNTDVLDARTGLSRAEANYNQALFEYNVALAALQRALGAAAEQTRIDEKEMDK